MVGFWDRKPVMPETIEEALEPLSTMLGNLDHVAEVMQRKAEVATTEATCLREEAEIQDDKAKTANAKKAQALKVRKNLANLYLE